MIEPPDAAVLLRLVLAALLGGAVGLERELQEKAAGLRTNILICVGAALFTELSGQLALVDSWAGTPDPTRISAQIVTGIGFLGAGTIIQSRARVRGLTTAATIWVVAAIGMAVGAGALSLAVGGTVLILLVLVGLGFLERRMKGGWIDVEIGVRVADEGSVESEVWEALDARGLDVALSEAQRDQSEGIREIRFVGKAPPSDLNRLVRDLMELPQVVSVRPKPP